MIKGIKKRIEKAERDYLIADYEDSLIQVLIAVAATSKKRYPRPRYRDREAFEKFLADDFGPAMGIIGGYIRIAYCDEMVSIEHLFYKFLRCGLLHDAAAPPDVEFVPPEMSITFAPRDDKLMMGYHLIQTLIRVVRSAPENQRVF